MPILNKEDMLAKLHEKFGDDSDDAILSIYEDISDTYDDYNTRVADSTNWKERYEQNDSEWREKYRSRFMSPKEDDEEDELLKPRQDPARKPKTFEELFKEE